MIKLHLNVGDKVRNIRVNSSRRGMIGFVEGEQSGKRGGKWVVKYQNGEWGTYFKELAHHSLEKAVSHQEAKIDTVAGKLWSPLKVKTVLSKVRRNVITGKTQQEMQRELGVAHGTHQFNTRCLGLSTGQAFSVIGEAMCNSNTPVRLWGVDHHLSSPECTSNYEVNKHFVCLVQALIGDMKGFRFDKPKQFMTYNPIVTEETYVENSL